MPGKPKVWFIGSLTCSVETAGAKLLLGEKFVTSFPHDHGMHQFHNYLISSLDKNKNWGWLKKKAIQWNITFGKKAVNHFWLSHLVGKCLGSVQ